MTYSSKTRLASALAPLTGVYSSEAVSSGHPDKICDQISDAVLDAALASDPDARVAVECAIKGHSVWLFGELTSRSEIDYEGIVHEVLRDVGHGEGHWGLNPARLDLRVSIDRQSAEIDAGVRAKGDGALGAGDQGIMFGYATAEATSGLPLPLDYARKLIAQLHTLRQRDPRLGPDAKAQVSVAYEDGRALGPSAIVVSAQHAPQLPLAELRELLRAEVIAPVFGDAANGAGLFLNPAGSFVEGGPVADAGLTGRKIIADTYGGIARHGGGAFSGKDGTKVDRSAAYAARQLALSVVKAQLADACEVRLAYAIGHPAPVAVDVAVDGMAGELPAILDEVALRSLFTPSAIIDRLGLTQPIFRQTARDGHFGVAGLPWEQAIDLDSLIGTPTRTYAERES